MDVSASLPLDPDGFLRRECPKCVQEFKWQSGPTNDRPVDWNDPPVYWCPLCGQASERDQFFTPAQVEFLQESAVAAQLAMLDDSMERALRGSRGLTYRRGNDGPEPPAPLSEPDDMNQVASPCHSWEPVKVSSSSTPPYFCLACGEAFTV